MQLAKLAGCHVIATAGGPAKAAMLRGLGADRVIDYKSESLKVGARAGGTSRKMGSHGN